MHGGKNITGGTERRMDIEERDKALHDCMNTIWKAYRTDLTTFNFCFGELHRKYPDDPVITQFIVNMGFALAPAANRKAGVV